VFRIVLNASELYCICLYNVFAELFYNTSIIINTMECIRNDKSKTDLVGLMHDDLDTHSNEVKRECSAV